MKHTKNKLLSSIATLIVCFAMLIGSTYAWFTDSASTGVNRIQAGNLDIEVEHTNAAVTTPENVEGIQNMFLNVNGDAMNWEPGAVSYETITVSNKGNLALKYSLTFNVNSYNTVVDANGTGTGKSLLDVLKVLVLETPLTSVTRETVSGLEWSAASSLSSFAKANRKLYPSTDTTAGHEDKETFQLIVYWPESAVDNDYNLQNGKYASDSNPSEVGNLFIKMGITVNATQLESESDSFDQNYDKDALLPEVSITEAVKEGTNYVIDNGTYINSSGVQTDIEDTRIPENVTMYDEHDSSTPIDTSDGQLSRKIETTRNDDTSTVNISIKFNFNSSSTTTEVKKFDKVVETIEDIGKNLEIDKVLHDGVELTALSSKPSSLVDSLDQSYYYNAVEGLIYVYSKTYSDFKVSYIRYWKDDTASALSIDEENRVISISTARELALLAKQVNNGTSYTNYTIQLENDIDLFGKRWTPIFENGTNWAGLAGSVFDGNNHTIKNMFVYQKTSAGLFGSSASALTIKNMNFYNADITTANANQTYAGVLMGKNYSPLTIENVNVDNAHVSNNWQCGVLVGFAETNGPSFKNCTIRNSFAGGNNATAGSLFGLGIVDVTVENCTAENVNLYTDSLTWNSTAKSVGNFAVGHLYGKTLTTNNYVENNVKVVQ